MDTFSEETFWEDLLTLIDAGSVPWGQLSDLEKEKEKERDRDVVRNIPRLIENAGLRLRRL